MGTLLRILFTLIVINQLILHITALRSSRGGTKYIYDKSTKGNDPKTYVGASSGLPSQSTAKKGLGISAWGIVGVAITIILAGTGFYYFTMCYPILCKKQRKYDMIGLPSVA
ncbi:unnamed protein product [Diatraea saccharalis]|uniref:Uncharacterized protein n=1 Tax=Diatraea saccharalis TaxID=40085 RepID=A0A9N9RH57_9NEOP|nr:unnamed protein product [Diatraea saccharalis]